MIASCNKISDKPVSEKLSTDELSKAIKSDTLFADFYEEIRKEVDDMSDIKKQHTMMLLTEDCFNM